MKDKSIVIRPATAMDSVNIVKLIKAGYAETPAKQIGELNEQKLLEYVTQTLRHAFVVIADQGSGRVVGTLGMAPIRMPWCDAVLMAETWFAVVPAYRNRRVPEQLLGALETFLDKNCLLGFLGTQMLTPADMNEILAKRTNQGYEASRHTFLRFPCRHTDEKGRPVIPPKTAVGA